jgi:hypothetical protein
MRIALLLAVCLLVLRISVCAQDTPAELRDIARNPFADVLKIPFQEAINFDAGPSNRTGSALQIQPVLPIKLTDEWLLIPRIVASALVYQPEVTQNGGGAIGLGDTVATFFITPVHVGKLIWGVGPAVLLPTATNSALGQGKWGLGPSFAVLTQPKWGSAGVLIQNLWSVAGNSQRAAVNQLELDLSFSYNLPHGWYLTSAPTITADWTQVTDERWLVPVGGGAGRSFNVGKQALDSNLAWYWNADRPANQLSPKWQISWQFTLLFPKPPKPPSQ